MLKGSSSHLPAAATAAAAVVVRPSRRRVLKALQALPLHALHLAYKSGPFATYDLPAWASGRPSREVVSSAAGLIITVTDGEAEGQRGDLSNTKEGALQGQGAYGGRSFCATPTSAGLDEADLISDGAEPAPAVSQPVRVHGR